MPSSPSRKVRTGGQVSREKILDTALGLFVRKGYAGTSVRDVAGAAGVNLAAISYHFGDKAGLYQAALHEFLVDEEHPAPPDITGLTLQDAMRLYMRTVLQPLSKGRRALLTVQLRVREYVEPSGLLAEVTADRDRVYQFLLDILTRHFGLDTPDDDTQALSFSIFALIAHIYSAQDHLLAMRPALLEAPAAASAWEDRFTAYALAMVAAETARRGAR
ncbi:CerR family C-terminal domain-containing protein [Oxalobacteraceae bacterium A2-2]